MIDLLCSCLSSLFPADSGLRTFVALLFSSSLPFKLSHFLHPDRFENATCSSKPPVADLQLLGLPEGGMLLQATG